MVNPATIGIFAIVCFILRVANAEVRTIFEKRYDFDDQLILSEENLYDNYKQLEGLPYAICRSRQYNWTEARCQIVLHSEILPEKSCDFALKATGTNDSVILDDKRVIRFGTQKVLVLWYETRRPRDRFERLPRLTNAIIVDLTTCQNKEILIPKEWKRFRFDSIITSYDDSFEFVLSKYGRKFYKLSIDKNGNVSDEIKPFILAENRSPGKIVMLNSATPTPRSYLYLEKTPEHESLMRILLIKPDGSQKLLMRHPPPEIPHFEDPFVSRYVSILHQTISIAISNRTSGRVIVHVQQFDYEGNSKKNLTLYPGYNIWGPPKIHNLPEGGLLLAGYEVSGDIFVTKFDSSGKRIGKNVIVKDDIGICAGDYKEYDKIDDNASGGYCVSFVCSPIEWLTFSVGPPDYSCLKLTVKCFTDQDFTAKV